MRLAPEARSRGESIGRQRAKGLRVDVPADRLAVREAAIDAVDDLHSRACRRRCGIAAVYLIQCHR
jgi:hypothetical protein